MAGGSEAAEEEGAAEAYEEDEAEGVWSNEYGFFDGKRFCMRTFGTWYRWHVPQRSSSSTAPAAIDDDASAERKLKPKPYPSVAEQRIVLTDQLQYQTPEHRHFRENFARKATHKFHSETGVAFGVDWAQTLGHMELSWQLSEEEAGLSEEDFVVELSSWELRVSVRDYVEGLQRLDWLSGDLLHVVHRKLSWWRLLEDDGMGSGRRLFISLAKFDHKTWNGPWYLHPKNLRRRRVISNMPLLLMLHDGPVHDEERMVSLPPGEPLDARSELLSTIEPEGLCTGVDEIEEKEYAFVVVHLDQERLDQIASKICLEEIFAADVREDWLEVFIRGVGYKFCWGELGGRCRPELTTWEVLKHYRRKCPASYGIRAPAYSNPVLRIRLTKMEESKGVRAPWGGAFSQMHTPKLAKPREPHSYYEIVQRSMVLAPTAPMDTSIKTAEAKKLCTAVESSQDDERVSIIMHMHPRLEEFALRYKLDLSTFFAMKVADRSLDMSVLADIEYSMCYGWLGGSCVPEQTSWELVKHEEESKADVVEVVAASGGGQDLTVSEAISMTKELLEAYSRPSFRHHLRLLEAEYEKGSVELRQERQRLTTSVQSRVLTRYGFEGSLSGVAQMAKLLLTDKFTQDEALARLTRKANVLLGLDASEAPPPLPDLAEDPRFEGTWRFKGVHTSQPGAFFTPPSIGYMSGTLEITRVERSLVATISILGKKVSGPLLGDGHRLEDTAAEPASETGEEGKLDRSIPKVEAVTAGPPHGKHLGPWLRFEAAVNRGAQLWSARFRLDEAAEHIFFDFRRSNDEQWTEWIEAIPDEEVKRAETRRQLKEPHMAVHVRVVKSQRSPVRWRRPFERCEPGDPLPEDPNALAELGEAEVGGEEGA